MEVNKPLLDEKIKASGLKIGAVANKIGISRMAFYNKVNNFTSFTVAEVFMLCDVLDILDDEKPKIFLDTGLDKTKRKKKKVIK